MSVYSGKSGIQSLMKGNAKKLAEQDESVLMTSGIPYTIIRSAQLIDTPGGKQGFTFEEVQALISSFWLTEQAQTDKYVGFVFRFHFN